MPEDSVFSNEPGTCPKCGMDLIKLEKRVKYTCPMHPEVLSDHPGECPKCGMDLEPIESKKEADTLSQLLQPTNQFVRSSLLPIAPSFDKGSKRIAVQGYLTYDPNKASSISARVGGRVEKLFVKANYQQVRKGEKLLEIYSPELQTAQSEYLYLLQHTSVDDDFALRALHSRLLNLGMREREITDLKSAEKASPFVSIYASANGHVHFLNGNLDISSHALSLPSTPAGMNGNPMEGEESQVLREGDYVKKGDLLFAIADQSAIWALLKVKPNDIASIRIGETVELSINNMAHIGKVDFIEKSFEDFYTARVYLPCDDHAQMKIGNLVEGFISSKSKKSESIWVPTQAVLSLGKSKSAVFVKKELGYKAKEIRTGSVSGRWIEVRRGLSLQDSIAPVAAYLVDSEAFIETLQEVINP